MVCLLLSKQFCISFLNLLEIIYEFLFFASLFKSITSILGSDKLILLLNLTNSYSPFNALVYDSKQGVALANNTFK